MANVNIDVQLKVIGNGLQAISASTKELVELEKVAQKTSNTFGKITDIAIGNFFADLAQGGLNLASRAFSELTEFVGDSIDAAIEAEDSINKLNFALASSGNFTQQASDDFQAFADEIQRTTKFEDDAIISTGAFIAQLTGLSGKALQEATLATADLATALGKDLDSAAQLLARSLEGNVTGLNKLGIEVRKGANDAETFGNVINALNEKGFGGASQNAVKTFGGTLTQLSNSFNELQEQVGFLFTKNQALAPIFGLLGDSINAVTEAIKANAPVLRSYIADTGSLITGLVRFLTGSSGLIANILPGAKLLGFGVALDVVDAKLKTLQQTFAFGSTFVGPTIDKATASIKNQKIAVDELSASQSLLVERGIALSTASQETAANQYTSQIEQQRLFLEQGIITQEEFFLLQQELRQAQYDEELNQLIAAEEAKKITKTQYDAAQRKASDTLFRDTLKLENEKTKKEKEEQKTRAENFKSTLGTIAGLQSSSSKELFAIGQAAAIATATIDGIAAVQKALASAPPPFNFALAALVGAATAVNIGKIASQKPPGLAKGLTEVPGGFNGDTFPAFLNTGERVVSGPQNSDLKEFINENGNNRSILESIRDLLAVGGKGVVVNIGGREIVNVLNDEIASGMVLNTG